MSVSPLSDSPLSDSEIRSFELVGHDLQRPECVLCKRDGTVFCSDERGGITRIASNGDQTYLGSTDAERFRPNGIALLEDGTLIYANLGSERGIWCIAPDETHYPLLPDHDLGHTNFVMVAADRSIWFSVMTTAPDGAPLSETRADGYIGRISTSLDHFEVMADKLNWANEFKIDTSRSVLYVNETFVGHTTKFDINTDGSLCNREILASYEPGTYPDGLALDSEGGLWITSVVSNRILHVTPEGKVSTLLDSSNAERVAEVRAALKNETLSRELVYRESDALIQNPTSIAFGGDDLCTAYVGSLNHSELRTFRTKIAGRPPVHWQW